MLVRQVHFQTGPAEPPSRFFSCAAAVFVGVGVRGETARDRAGSVRRADWLKVIAACLDLGEDQNPGVTGEGDDCGFDAIPLAESALAGQRLDRLTDSEADVIHAYTYLARRHQSGFLPLFAATSEDRLGEAYGK